MTLFNIKWNDLYQNFRTLHMSKDSDADFFVKIIYLERLHWYGELSRCDFWPTLYLRLSGQAQTLHDDAPMPGRHCSTVSDSTLDTGLWDCVTTVSPFRCQPSTDSSVTSTGHIWWSGVLYIAGPSTWNSLPKRDPSIALFGRLLKTFFFSEY